MDIVIVGAGASGLTAAIHASKNKNTNRTLIERNNVLGKKILATGNGKCNYYNSDQDLSHYHSTNNELIKEIINNKNLKEVEDFFNYLGIIPKIRNGYYYPFSNQATTIRNALVNELNKSNIKILDNEKVTSIKKENNKFIIKTENNSIKADKVIISTGSYASPKTGSDGMGYNFLKEFNHTIIKPLPALVQLKANASFLKEWSGIRTDIKASLYIDNEFIKSEEGEIQLTNYGISGICIFNLSRFVSRALNDNKQVKIKLNFLPIINNIEETLTNLNKSNKTIKNLLDGILNSKLVDIIIKISSINPNKKYNELSQKELTNLINNLTNLSLDITGTNSFDECQVTTGGIPLTEINLSTMESKKEKGLYITGELLDVDGDCGGYNLTFAWITGILAGSDNND